MTREHREYLSTGRPAATLLWSGLAGPHVVPATPGRVLLPLFTPLPTPLQYPDGWCTLAAPERVLLTGPRYLGLVRVHYELQFLNLGLAGAFSSIGVVGWDLGLGTEVTVAEFSLSCDFAAGTTRRWCATTQQLPLRPGSPPLGELGAEQSIELGVALSWDQAVPGSVQVTHASAWVEQRAVLLQGG